jgi:hypothetical protein
MQLQTPCPSKITCRPNRRQTLNATNEKKKPKFCAKAPFVPTVQVLCNWDQEKFGHTCETQMFSPPIPCQQPTPKPLSPAARRPACQAHIQRSREFDTSATAACQTPMNMHKLCTSKGAGPSNGRFANVLFYSFSTNDKLPFTSSEYKQDTTWISPKSPVRNLQPLPSFQDAYLASYPLCKQPKSKFRKPNTHPHLATSTNMSVLTTADVLMEANSIASVPNDFRTDSINACSKEPSSKGIIKPTLLTKALSVFLKLPASCL